MRYDAGLHLAIYIIIKFHYVVQGQPIYHIIEGIGRGYIKTDFFTPHQENGFVLAMVAAHIYAYTDRSRRVIR